MLGAHLSIVGGLHNALLSAERFGMQTVQIFTKNQQRWRSPPLRRDSITQWKRHTRRLRFRQTVSHASYLINLASPDEAQWRRSIDLFVEELARCRGLGIDRLVIHPGAHMGAGEQRGLARVVEALNIAHELIGTRRVLTCLEVTAGQGSSVGHRLEHLAWIIDHVCFPQRLAVCLDTAHLYAAGYDFGCRRYGRFTRQVDSIVGLSRVKVLHLNDSKRPLGSRVDRHEHIGRGTIGLAGFRPFLRDAMWRDIPRILETPKGRDPDGRDWDEVNLGVLRELAQPARPALLKFRSPTS